MLLRGLRWWSEVTHPRKDPILSEIPGRTTYTHLITGSPCFPQVRLMLSLCHCYTLDCCLAWGSPSYSAYQICCWYRCLQRKTPTRSYSFFGPLITSFAVTWTSFAWVVSLSSSTWARLSHRVRDRADFHLHWNWRASWMRRPSLFSDHWISSI